jgi:carbamoyl-phosphate synthase large subunit
VTLVKTFRAALTNHGGGKVIAADIDTGAAALYFADEYVMVPRSDDKQFIPHLLDLCRQKEIKLLISSRDDELLVLSKEKHQFEDIKEIDCRVMVADYDTIKTCRDKRLFCKFCEENDIPIPETYYNPDEVEIKGNSSVFIKPVTGAGSLKIHKVSNRDEFQLLKKIYRDDFLVQEYMTWPEYTVDLFADFEGRIISVIPRERVRTVGGESYIGKTFKSDLIINESVRLAEKLGLIGHNTLQCFFNGEEVKFIEVNPRFGGGANLGFHSGANTPEFLIRILQGETIEPMIGQFRENLVMLRYTQDVFFEEMPPEPGSQNGTPGLVNIRSQETGQIYCIDVDGTVCTERVKYEEAKPIEKTIRKINELYDKGNTIILYTARGAYSGVDWSELTEKQLKSWGVKYHQFLRGKPFAHEYVDNKAVHILDWI